MFLMANILISYFKKNIFLGTSQCELCRWTIDNKLKCFVLDNKKINEIEECYIM